MPKQNKTLTYVAQWTSSIVFLWVFFQLEGSSSKVLETLARNNNRNVNFSSKEESSIPFYRLLFLSEAIGQILVGLSAFLETTKEDKLFRNDLPSHLAWIVFTVTSSCRFTLSLLFLPVLLGNNYQYFAVENSFQVFSTFLAFFLALYVWKLTDNTEGILLKLGAIHCFPSVIIFAVSFFLEFLSTSEFPSFHNFLFY